jgi:sporulation protein YlmC with PRC-barrel domain
MLSTRTAWCVVLVVCSVVAILQPSAESQQKDETVPFIGEQAPDQWRASKLIGIDVYDPQGQKIGSIGEVLIDHDGVAQVAVLDVGGFLGIGMKAVGVPFNALKWVSHEDVAPKTVDAPPSKPSVGAIFNAAEPKPATDAAKGYPHHAIIRLIKARLGTAPDFRYGRTTAFRPNAPGGPLNTFGGPAGDP